MNPSCARCGKIVYPTEKVNCLDKVGAATGEGKAGRACVCGGRADGSRVRGDRPTGHRPTDPWGRVGEMCRQAGRDWGQEGREGAAAGSNWKGVELGEAVGEGREGRGDWRAAAGEEGKWVGGGRGRGNTGLERVNFEWAGSWMRERKGQLVGRQG